MNSNRTSASAITRGQPALAIGLAAGVHIALALLLLFGFSWHIPAPTPVQVELWAAPSRAVRSTPAVPAPERPRAAPPPVVEPAPELANADIKRLVDDKKPRQEPRAEPKPDREPKPQPRSPDKAEPVTKVPEKSSKPTPAQAPSRYIPQPGLEDEVPVRPAATSGATGSASTNRSGARSAELLETYLQGVTDLIRSRVTQPPGVTGNPMAEFRIVILAGMVIDDHPQLVRKSGDEQWDAAAERAILLSRQLPPLPPGLVYGPQFRSVKVQLCLKTCSR